MTARGDGIDSRRTDTRERALAVAQALFLRQGYAATSLREIAEQLGVTKAALYFHFRTKEEILTAILRGYVDGIAAIIAEAENPLTAEGRETLLRRFAAHQQQWGIDLVMLVRQNFTEVQSLPIGTEVRDVMQSLVAALAGPDGGPQQRLRARLALSAFQIAALTVSDEKGWDEESLRATALALALEIIRGERQ